MAITLDLWKFIIFLSQTEEEDELDITLEEPTANEGTKRKAAERLNPRKKVKPEDALLKDAHDALKSLSNQPPSPVPSRPRDDLDIFGEMIASELRLITDPLKRQVVKGKIHRFITHFSKKTHRSSSVLQLSLLSQHRLNTK